MAVEPGNCAVPRGMRVAVEPQTRVLDDGAVLLGGAPPVLLRLTPAAVALLKDGSVTVDGPTSAALARRLLDAGIAHPVDVPAAAVPRPSDVTVVIPVKDRADGLAALLAALLAAPPGERAAAAAGSRGPVPSRPGDLGELIVVDDGSADPAAIAAAARAGGARLLRHPASRGPSAARNTGLAAATTELVAFLDSDVVPEPGWLDPLLAAFADPAVGLAAPRIIASAPITGWLARYEAVRSSLDLGPDAALIVPRSRVAYVPSAALLVRRSAAEAGFDEDMHVAEDVDLVLRLHAAGWRLRYVPAARVAHDHRTTLRSWWLRKAYYGTGAAPLALRHPGAVPPMVVSPWSVAVTGLLLVGRPRSVVAAVAVGAVASERLARKLHVRRPRATAARLVALGALGAAGQGADAITRHFWPLALVAALFSRRARRTVVVVALVEGAVDWWRHRDRDPRVRPGVGGYVLAHRLDDLAYGAGLWWGAWRHRTVEPLRPVGSRAARDRRR